MSERGLLRVHNEVPLLTASGTCVCVTFDWVDSTEPLDDLLIVFGDARRQDTPIVRMHSQCITGEVLGSLHCDCGKQLEEFLTIAAGAGGILAYLYQEGRGIGIKAKIDAYKLQAQGFDTYDANRELGFPEDARPFSHVTQMLTAVGVSSICLHTNNPSKAQAIEESGINVSEIIPTGTYANPVNAEYLLAKVSKGGQGLDL